MYNLVYCVYTLIFNTTVGTNTRVYVVAYDNAVYYYIARLIIVREDKDSLPHNDDII